MAIPLLYYIVALGIEDEANMSGKFLNYPQRADIPENIKEQYIVELYSK